MPEIILKPGREKSVLRRHPWIFSGAIAAVNGSPNTGETVEVISTSGQTLARAAYNPISNITGRIWTWDPQEPVDKLFFENRIRQSIELRTQLGSLINSDALRLVHGESDGLPGMILDRYGGTYVIQFLSAGTEYWKEELIRAIQACAGASYIYERSDIEVRQLEGLPATSGLLVGDTLASPIEITENDIQFLVDIAGGQKTGFYLDQRDNRLLARMLSTNRRVLDCFAYTGGFAVNCLKGDAKHVTLVESSKGALEIAHRNMSINNIHPNKVEFVEQDVFRYLRTLRDKGVTYDLVILDPPKFAPTASQAEKAARGYKDINLLAFKLLQPGGYLLTFSCSGGVSEELYQKIVNGAALDAGAEAVILKRLHQAPDHPVALNFPEGAYLKGFLIQKLK
jgi:23S rRNA (cytosine1962-C5)-methyltransferase